MTQGKYNSEKTYMRDAGQVKTGAVIDLTSEDYIDDEPFSIFVGTAGTVVVDFANEGTNITFDNIVDGSFLPIQVTKVYQTSTATNMVALK